MSSPSRLPELIQKYESRLLDSWCKDHLMTGSSGSGKLPESEVRAQAAEFLNGFREALQRGGLDDLTTEPWERLRQHLTGLSRLRVRQGFSPSETATFVLSLKQPLFHILQNEIAHDVAALVRELEVATRLIDTLGLFTMEQYIKSREEVISRQQAEMLELSTPVVQLWEKILALPIIGTLDSARTQVVMENLLQRIVDTSSSIAIIDITGVPTVDTLVAQHLIKTVSAARLMGAECLISGIRPAIAQAMVHLGVTFNDVVTKATLADAIRYAFSRVGLRITRSEAPK